MHELSIANSILDTVRAEAEKRPGARVVKVGVRIGELSGVNPDALSFGFEVLVRGTDLEPLALEIESMPRRQRCPVCEQQFAVKDSSLVCPKCGELETIWVGGDELELAYLELEQQESPASGRQREDKTSDGCLREAEG
jgi:hydrogenase nickel incorporation protein HypA/HybF